MAFRIPQNETDYRRLIALAEEAEHKGQHRRPGAPSVYRSNAENLLIADGNGELGANIIADSWEPRLDGTIEARRFVRDESGKRISQGLGYEFKTEPIVLDATKVTVP